MLFPKNLEILKASCREASVSYTHLDVYKRQAVFVPECAVYVQENYLNHFPYLPYPCDLILAKNKGPGNSLDPLKIFVHL